jgi:hypothetical protein
MTAGLVAAGSRWEMFGANIYLLIGLLLAGGLLVLIVVAIWTGVKVVWWREQRRRADAAELRRKLGPNGRPYPPASRGVCGRCARASDTVYHLAAGERLCAGCYALSVSVKRGDAESTEIAEKTE